MLQRVLVLFALLLPTLSLASTGWTLDSSSASCSGAFSLDSFSLSCSEESTTCSMGDTATIAGQITSTSLLPETANVTAKFCALWYLCYSYDIASDADICSALTSEGGTNCPEAGTYSFDKTVSSPGSSSWSIPSWLQGYTISVTVTILDTSSGGASLTTCTSTATAADSSSSSSSAQLLVGAAVVGLAVLSSALWIRQKRHYRTGTMATSSHGASLLEMQHVPHHQVV